MEPGDPKAALISAIVAVMDASGQVAGQWTARRAELARSPLLTAVPVAAGTYRVRVAASDENGRGGIAEYEARAQLQGSGRGTWSTIVLGVAAPAGFAPRLLFADEPSAVAYVEVYGAASAADVKATFEIAANADGPALVSASAEATRGEGFVMLTAPLSLAAVPPGDSVVRARITIDGAPAGTALATLRKSGR